MQKEAFPLLECKSSYFDSWKNKETNQYATKDDFQLYKVPYPSITLVQGATEALTVDHYSELVTYLRENPAKQSVYIHSASIYTILLIGVSCPADVSLVIGHDYPEKYALLTTFVMNNIRDKLVFEKEAHSKINL